MSRLIESICINDGEIRNLKYHQKRMDNSRFELFGLKDVIDLKKAIQISEKEQIGKYKCRIVYAEEIESIEFIPYEIRTIKSFRLVENEKIDYQFKFENRKIFDEMKEMVGEDEIIILQKGKICDTSYSNLVFFDGEQWITPTSYLLNGTMRQYLLDTTQIIEDEIYPKDLNRFLTFKMINAMMDLDESPELSINLIH